MRVFKEIFWSIFKVDNYKELIKNKTGMLAVYVSMLSLLAIIATVLSMAFGIQAKGGGFAQFIEESVPEFGIVEGRIWVDERYVIDDAEHGTFIYVDTEEGLDRYKYDLDKIIDEYKMVMIVDSEGIISKSNNQITNLRASDIDTDIHFTADDIKASMKYIYIAIVIILLLVYLFMILGYFFNALIYAIFGIAIAAAFKVKMKFSSLYKICIYAKTAVVILNILLVILGITLPFALFVNILITLVYICAAIYSLKNSVRGVEGYPADLSAEAESLEEYYKQREENNKRADRRNFHQNQDKEYSLPRRTYETEKNTNIPKEEDKEKISQDLEVNRERARDISPSDGWSFGGKDLQGRESDDIK